MPGFQFQSSVTYDTPRTSDFTLQDNINLKFGTGGDATIDYNGTDLIIDPQVVGSGNLKINAGDLDMNSQGSILNVKVAGNDWTANLLVLTSTFDGQQIIRIANTRNGSVGNDAVISIQAGGDVGGDPMVEFTITSQQTVVMGLDNTATDNFTISDNTALGTNDRLRLVTNTGVLSLDGSGAGDALPTLFDKYDDALELRTFQLANVPTSMITKEQQLENQRRLVEIGVAEWAIQDDGSYHWMMRIQPMTRLLAGGVYQNRLLMNEQYDEFDKRLKAIGA